MADVLNNFAISRLAQYILGVAPADPTPKLALFVSNTTIDCTTVPGGLTECSAPGYARITLTPGTWMIGSPVACVVECAYGAVDFILTGNGGGQIVYGHYVIDSTANLILWAQDWITPWTIPSLGGIARVDLFYNSQQCP